MIPTFVALYDVQKQLASHSQVTSFQSQARCCRNLQTKNNSTDSALSAARRGHRLQTALNTTRKANSHDKSCACAWVVVNYTTSIQKRPKTDQNDKSNIFLQPGVGVNWTQFGQLLDSTKIKQKRTDQLLEKTISRGRGQAKLAAGHRTGARYASETISGQVVDKEQLCCGSHKHKLFEFVANEPAALFLDAMDQEYSPVRADLETEARCGRPKFCPTLPLKCTAASLAGQNTSRFENSRQLELIFHQHLCLLGSKKDQDCTESNPANKTHKTVLQNTEHA